MGKMISIDIGTVGRVRVVTYACPCGETQSAPIDKPGTMRGAVLRITDHTRICAESSDSGPVSRENASTSIDRA